VHGPDTDHDLAALRDAFPGYRFRRRFVRGVPCYLAEACSAEARGAVGRGSDVRGAQALAAAACAAPLAAAYRDRQLTLKQCAAMFGCPVRRS
jgi:hypothetical protein